MIYPNRVISEVKNRSPAASTRPVVLQMTEMIVFMQCVRLIFGHASKNPRQQMVSRLGQFDQTGC